MSDAARKQLRVGVLLNATETTSWADYMLKTLRDGNYADIVLFIVDDSPNPQRNKPVNGAIQNLAGRIANRIAELVYKIHIERDFGTLDAFAPRELRDSFPDTPVLKVKTIKKQLSDYIPPDNIKTIKSYKLDVLIRVGFRILRGDILHCAKYGVWSYHHGDNTVNRGGPPCYWETMESWPETGSLLQILSEDLDNGKVLYRSASATDRFSVKATRDNLYWKTQSFIPRVMQRLHQQGDSFLSQLDENPGAPRFYSARLFLAASQFEHFRLIANKAFQKLGWVLHNKRNLRQWVLMYDLNKGHSTSPWRYKTLTPPKDRFWADPHIIHRNNKYYIYFEELPFATNKGHISLIEMSEDGTHSEPVAVLVKPYHLSYPFVFEHEGDTWMIPESGENKTVELYRCTQFPDQWEWVMNLMDGVCAVDATLHYHQGLWWMFTNIAAHPSLDNWDELHLFYAKDFRTNEWTPHTLNPVVSDVKNARPAGKLFIENGKLYRPSQNCSHRYGYGFNLSEIVELSTTNYQERVISRVTPDWDKHVVATHTYNKTGDLCMMDAMRVRRR